MSNIRSWWKNPQESIFRNSFSNGSVLRILVCLLYAAALMFLSGFVTYAEEIPYQNSDTGYCVIIDDQAGLLKPEERAWLADTMKPLTDYGNAAFLTVSENDGSAQQLAEKYSYDHFHNCSSVAFLIDMDNRMLYIASAGTMEKNIGKSGAETIADNVYQYASAQKYYYCAASVYEQILNLEEGKRIAQSMKYINNALLALLLAMLIMFVTVTRVTGIKAASDRQLLAGAGIGMAAAAAPVIRSIGKTIRRIESSSDGGGFSGGGGGSDSGGGGGFSGSGGGHSF